MKLPYPIITQQDLWREFQKAPYNKISMPKLRHRLRQHLRETHGAYVVFSFDAGPGQNPRYKRFCYPLWRLRRR